MTDQLPPEDPLDHAETGQLDTPKERALRHDYEEADAEVQILKAELKRVRMIPVSEEREAAIYWRARCLEAEAALKKLGVTRHLEKYRD